MKSQAPSIIPQSDFLPLSRALKSIQAQYHMLNVNKITSHTSYLLNATAFYFYLF